MKLTFRISLLLVFMCAALLMPFSVASAQDDADGYSDDYPAYEEEQDFFRGGYYEDDVEYDFSDYPGDDYQSDSGESADAGDSYQQPTAAPRPPALPAGEPIKLEEKSIRFGRIPYLSMRDMMTQAVPLLRFLQKETGAKEVRLVSNRNSYASILDALARGNIDFAWVGPTAYLNRRDQDHLMPVAKAKFGEATAYRGVFIAPAKGKVQGLEDIKGSSIAFVDPESASGYIYPLYLLKELGVDPHKHSKVYFVKNHDNVLRAVLEGKVDSGVCLEETLKKLNKAQLERIIILGKTNEIPSDVIVCRQDCPINLREKFLEALLKVKPEALPGSPTFLPAYDEEFDSVLAVMRYIESLKPQN